MENIDQPYRKSTIIAKNKIHNVALGTLVEITNDEIKDKKGLRLFVVDQCRDKDCTPTYSLSFEKNWKDPGNIDFYSLLQFAKVDQGYVEEDFSIVNNFN